MSAVLKLKVEGLHCASCVARLETALQELPQVNAASVNLGSETAVVTLGRGGMVPESLAGFSLTAKESKPVERPQCGSQRP